MILSAEIIKQIQNGRRSMVRLPTKGKPAPVHPGREYVVKPSQKAPVACIITVDSVEETLFEDRPTWIIRFRHGSHADTQRIPAAKPGPPHGDYVDTAARGLSGCDSEVSETLQARYALEAHESHTNGSQERRERLLKAIGQIRLEMARQGLGSPRARKLLKSTEHELRLCSKRRVA